MSDKLKVDKVMENLLSLVSKKSVKKHKKTKIVLNKCKGKTKDNKECSRKELENCNGFCKQHFMIEKEKAETIELIEKLKK